MVQQACLEKSPNLAGRDTENENEFIKISWHQCVGRGLKEKLYDSKKVYTLINKAPWSLTTKLSINLRFIFFLF